MAIIKSVEMGKAPGKLHMDLLVEGGFHHLFNCSAVVEITPPVKI
jgi:hypothetical protein